MFMPNMYTLKEFTDRIQQLSDHHLERQRQELTEFQVLQEIQVDGRRKKQSVFKYPQHYEIVCNEQKRRQQQTQEVMKNEMS